MVSTGICSPVEMVALYRHPWHPWKNLSARCIPSLCRQAAKTSRTILRAATPLPPSTSSVASSYFCPGMGVPPPLDVRVFLHPSVLLFLPLPLVQARAGEGAATPPPAAVGAEDDLVTSPHPATV
uniref:Uncharacterized protein n=1 Tax=Arundo donax TaxID=35708 RepID=A0A0A8XPS4_ARUDO